MLKFTVASVMRASTLLMIARSMQLSTSKSSVQASNRNPTITPLGRWCDWNPIGRFEVLDLGDARNIGMFRSHTKASTYETILKDHFVRSLDLNLAAISQVD